MPRVPSWEKHAAPKSMQQRIHFMQACHQQFACQGEAHRDDPPSRILQRAASNESCLSPLFYQRQPYLDLRGSAQRARCLTCERDDLALHEVRQSPFNPFSSMHMTRCLPCTGQVRAAVHGSRRQICAASRACVHTARSKTARPA